MITHRKNFYRVNNFKSKSYNNPFRGSKIVLPVLSWANKISLRDAPANPENGGLITQNTVIISLSLGIAFLCVCVYVCSSAREVFFSILKVERKFSEK